MMRLVEQGKIKPVIQEIFALEDVSRTQAMLDARQVFGKLLLDPTRVAPH